MSILKVARMGNPILRTKTKALSPSDITSAPIQQLIDDMLRTMLEYNGVGLAAPQVHEKARLFVAQIIADGEDEEERDPKAPPQLMAIINPEITPVGRHTEQDWEGCLSIPDMRGLVPRHRDIRVKGFDRHGDRIEIEASGYMARVIQHEADHLDGILFVDRMKSLESLSFLEEYGRYHTRRDEE